MKNQILPAPADKKFEFLQSVLEIAEKRRDAVENKASILLASNAILLTAIASSTLSTIITRGALDWISFAFELAALLGVAISSVCAIVVLARPIEKLRQVNIPSAGFDVFFFGRIAKHKDAATYLGNVQSLTEMQVLDQLATQAHNLSSILVYRYEWFERSHRAFIVGILSFIIQGVIKMF